MVVQPLLAGAFVGAASGFYGHREARSAGVLVGGGRGVSGTVLGTPVLVTVGIAAGTAVGERFPAGYELAAYLLLVAAAVLLSAVDAAAHRLPDRLLIPAIPLGAVLLAIAAQSSGTFAPWRRAVLIAAISFVAFLVLALATGGLGYGDCKAAGFVGLFTGYLGCRTAFIGFVAAFTLAAVVVMVRALLQGPVRRRFFAFGPYLFSGALLAIVTTR